jgi:cytochrome c oxidase subunit II
VLAVATLAFFALAAPAFAGIAPEEAHSPGAEEIRTTYWVMLIVIVALALAAVAGLLMAYRRFRVRSHRDLRQPRRLVAGRGTVARVASGLGALALVIFIFGIVMTGKTNDALADEDASGEPITIRVVGQQWLWRFEYPVQAEGGASEGIATVFSYSDLVVPVDTTVNLQIDSTDVLHRWFIPALGGQVQAVPGEITETSFRADAEGVYEGQSTQFSGTAYPAMRARVRVVSQDDYDSYLETLTADLREAQIEVAEEVSAQAAEGTAP